MDSYNPNQPRVPAGNPNGGQWTSGQIAVAEQAARQAAGLLATPDEIEKVLRHHEKSIRELEYEQAYFIDAKTGDLIGAKTSFEKDRVDFNPEKEDAKLLEQARGAIMTHNHPSALRIGISYPVSGADIKFADDFQLSAVRAVTPDYTFTVRPLPGKGWGEAQRLNPGYVLDNFSYVGGRNYTESINRLFNTSGMSQSEYDRAFSSRPDLIQQAILESFSKTIKEFHLDFTVVKEHE